MDEAASELRPCPALDRRECTGRDTEYDCHSSRMRAVAHRIREALGEGA